MRKTICFLLITILLLAGCGKADALSQSPWQRTQELPAGSGAEFLSALDFTPEEIALSALGEPATVQQIAFTAQGTYRLTCDAEATRALTRDYLDTFLSALCANPAALSAVYNESFGVDMAAMSEAECRDFYAEIFGCEDYEALLDHLTDAFYDYEALAAWGEAGSYTIRGKMLFLSDTAGVERGYVDFALTEDSLTLTYADKTLEYRKAA